MDMKPELYSKINGLHRRDAQNIVKKIVQDGLDGAKICVDIGCGSGEVTQIIASAIPSAHVFAFDIDAAMVEYAAKSLTCVGDKNLSSDQDDTKKIDFFKDDIGNSWENLTERLRSLEGRVDIIWSNLVLHWIPQKYQQRAASNILRLLKSDGKGRLYLNVTLLRPIPVLAGNKNIRDVLIVPSMQEQATVWLQYFKLEPFQLSALEGNIATPEWSEHVTRTSTRENVNYILGGFKAITEKFLQNYKSYFLCNMTDEEKEAAFTECSPSLSDQHISVTERTNETVITASCDVLEIRAIKIN